MNPILQAILAALGTGGGGLFGGLNTPASGGGLSPAILAQLGITAPVAAGGANPGILTQLGQMLNPANPMAGLLQLVSGGAMLPFASKGESSIENVMSFLSNPQKFANLFKQIAAPMNKTLVKTLQSEGEGAAAESGLGQSAGAVSSAVAKAAAPYVQQNISAAPGNALNLLQQQMAGASQFGSPYAAIARMFQNPEQGGSLGF